MNLKKKHSDDLLPYVSSTAAILILSSIILPVPAIIFLQDLLFFSYDHLSFIRPNTAYMTFGAGLFFMGIVLVSFWVTKKLYEKREKDYNLVWLHSLLLVAGMAFLVLSVNHYHFLDEKGAYSNTFFSLSEQGIEWEEIENVSREVEEGSLRVLSYTFSDGENSVTIPYSTEDNKTNETINIVRQAYNWDVQDEVVE